MPRVLNTIHTTRGRLVCRIWNAALDKMYKDNEAKAPFDRYTIAFKAQRDDRTTYYPYLTCSENPTHPQGFGQWGESRKFMTGKHLGKRVSFDSLPPQVQAYILQNI
jgi:hypothetical protein